MHSLGGIKAGLEIFNLAILPKPIYNADTWYEMNSQAINRLENIQNILMNTHKVSPQCIQLYRTELGLWHAINVVQVVL